VLANSDNHKENKMSNEKEGKIDFKSIGGLIGIVVSVIAIFTFITGISSLDLLANKNKPDSRSPYSPNESSNPSNTIPTEISAFEAPIPTLIGIYNPVGVVQSDMPIYVDGLALIYRNIEAIGTGGDNIIRLELYVKNTGEKNRIFRYVGASVIFRDDVGNTYQQLDRCGGVYDALQLNVDVGQSQLVTTNRCSAFYFIGTIAQQAKSIFIGFKDFGPFTDFEIEVKL
jgi:hypothetical protein